MLFEQAADKCLHLLIRLRLVLGHTVFYDIRIPRGLRTGVCPAHLIKIIAGDPERADADISELPEVYPGSRFADELLISFFPSGDLYYGI